MRRKTDSNGHAHVLANAQDRSAMARVADYFFLQASCERSNGNPEAQTALEAIGQRVHDELRHAWQRAEGEDAS